MSKTRKTKRQRESELWSALGDVLAGSADSAYRTGWETIDVLRSNFPSLSLAQLRATLEKKGIEATRGKQLDPLTKLVKLVHICGAGERVAQDLENAKALIDLAMSHSDLEKKAAQTASSKASAQAKGAEQVDIRIQHHINTLNEAASHDEAAFKAAVKALFSDKALDSKARKKVVAAVTGSPAQLLGSDGARLDELERWRSDGHFQVARAKERAGAATRF